MKVSYYLLVLRPLDFVEVLVRLLISEIMEFGRSSLADNLGFVLDGVSGKSCITGLSSPANERFKHLPPDKLIRVIVLIVFRLECGGRTVEI